MSSWTVMQLSVGGSQPHPTVTHQSPGWSHDLLLVTVEHLDWTVCRLLSWITQWRPREMCNQGPIAVGRGTSSSLSIDCGAYGTNSLATLALPMQDSSLVIAPDVIIVNTQNMQSSIELVDSICRDTTDNIHSW